MANAKMEFREKPATEDEIMIADILAQIARSLEKADMQMLASVFSEQALITMAFSETPLPKKVFLEKASRLIGKGSKVTYKNILIRIKSDTGADVSCNGFLFTRNYLVPKIFHRYFHFKKYGVRWLIETMR